MGSTLTKILAFCVDDGKCFVVIGNGQHWGVSKNFRRFVDELLKITDAMSIEEVVGREVRARLGANFSVMALGHATDNIWMEMSELVA